MNERYESTYGFLKLKDKAQTFNCFLFSIKLSQSVGRMFESTNYNLGQHPNQITICLYLPLARLQGQIKWKSQQVFTLCFQIGGLVNWPELYNWSVFAFLIICGRTFSATWFDQKAFQIGIKVLSTSISSICR